MLDPRQNGDDSQSVHRPDASNQNTCESTSQLTRRSALKTIGGVSASIVGISSLTDAANARTAGGGGNWGLYDRDRTVIQNPNNNEPFAEVHSSVVGPDHITPDFGTANQGMSFGVSFADSSLAPAVKNVEITIDEVSTPGGYDFSSIAGYKQDGNNPSKDIVQYALDTLWGASVGLVLPVPSPFGLTQDGSANVGTGRNGQSINASFGDKEMAGMRWNLDLHAGQTGEAVPGDYKFRVTCRADVGYIGTGMYNSGFQKFERVEQQLNETVTVG